MPSSRPSRPVIAAAAALGALVMLAGCSSGATPVPSSLPSPDASAGHSSVPSAPPDRGTVRFALDWVPNTNHTGLYVALARGWYDEAGVDVSMLPYTGTTPETLMTAGQAECGISFGDALTFAVAAGAPVVSVAAVLQRTASAIGVLADSGIERPRDLDGRTYAGFGYPNEEPTVRAVIRADGGTGEFRVVTLDTAAYEALYSKRADMTIVFTAWEGVEAARRGIALRYFDFVDYGFPEMYQVVVACDRRWIEREPDLARRFVEATVRGYELAAAEPEAASAILVEENPGVFEGDPGLPLASQRYLADGGYLLDAEGRFGTQTVEQWTGVPAFLYEAGLLTGPDGKPLSAPPDYAALFTNELLPDR